MDLTGASVAFDLDGTLVDTAPDLIGALNVVLGERGLPPLPVEAARVLVGRGARVLIERGFAVAGEGLSEDEAPGLVARFIAVYRERIAHESRPFPGVVAALNELVGAGARLSVCTNKPTDLAVLLLEALELRHWFFAVIGADLAPAQKPDPRHYVAAIEAGGGAVALSVMVGDSAADVRAAHAAGAPVVVVSFGYTETPAADLGGDVLIDGFGELPAVVDRLISERRAGLSPARPFAIASAL